MRYELRQWNDSAHTAYTLKATSDDVEVLQAYLNRPSTPNEVYYRLHIVDTQA